GQIAEPPLRRERVGGDVDAVDGGGPAVGGEAARDDPQRRRLAGAVGAEEADDLAALDGEADAVEGDRRAVAFDEGGDLDHGAIMPDPARPRPSSLPPPRRRARGRRPRTACRAAAAP